LAARHTDVLESLEPNVRKRVEVLREIQVKQGSKLFYRFAMLLWWHEFAVGDLCHPGH
jgi:hypothetical protein